ncbi:Chitin synthase export chaperone [Sphaceloma murrayae]|uniref:Chitin synthase export chaperone n=1 Tax=Sphaceloma murrayae TaxID=2082308 RepID=A0A2K1QWA9_9PEZI|nr:Chitin synthase export chaperone [Sphaceloma murrayae]
MGFGDFDMICSKAALPLCPLVGPPNAFTGTQGIQPQCYSRSISLANTIIFQGAAGFAHILALIMTVIMIIHVRSKFTAVGTSHKLKQTEEMGKPDKQVAFCRKEITTFFYMYLLLSAFSLILDCGVVPLGSAAYPYFVAAQAGLASSTCVCLMINGFVGFQLYEDGTRLSVWLLRTCVVALFAISFAISILTFKSVAGLSPTNTVGLFVVLYLFNGIFLAVYVVMQVLLVVGTLQERWPLGHISFGVFFFVIGQVILYVFADQVCEGVQHYMDGLLFATVCNLLAVMMVYKYWDSITREDLEFSVGQRLNNWEVKELMQDNDHATTDYQDSDYAASMYQPRHRTSVGGSTGY